MNIDTEKMAEGVMEALDQERQSLKDCPLIEKLLARLESLDGPDGLKTQILRAERQITAAIPTRMGCPPHPAKVAITKAALLIHDVSLDGFCESVAAERARAIEAARRADRLMVPDCADEGWDILSVTYRNKPN